MGPMYRGPQIRSPSTISFPSLLLYYQTSEEGTYLLASKGKVGGVQKTLGYGKRGEGGLSLGGRPPEQRHHQGNTGGNAPSGSAKQEAKCAALVGGHALNGFIDLLMCLG